jgi:hypothetical protein
LQWRRHASSSVSGERDRFDAEAGGALLLHRTDMAGGGAAACGCELLVGVCAGGGGARVASEGLDLPLAPTLCICRGRRGGFDGPRIPPIRASQNTGPARWPKMPHPLYRRNYKRFEGPARHALTIWNVILNMSSGHSCLRPCTGNYLAQWKPKF